MQVFFNRKLILGVPVASSLFLATPNVSRATPIPLDLVIEGEVEFDEVFADDSTFGAVTQLGAFSVTEGEATTMATYIDATVAGTNPLLGTLTHTGDGMAVINSSIATDDGEFGVGFDLFMSLLNTSLTDTYLVTLEIIYDNFVNADGDDAYADSEYWIETLSDGEIFFTDLISDTVNGDEVAGDLTGGFGDPLADVLSTTFDILLDPNGGYEEVFAILTLEGGAFPDVSTAEAIFSASIRIVGVENLTNPDPVVPEPSALAIWSLLGMVGIAFGVKRRRKSA